MSNQNQNNPSQQNQNPSQKPGQQQGGGQKPGQQKHDDLIEKIEEDNRRGDQADGVGGGT